MATIYCWSGATGAANGTSWADAHLTVTAALASATDADTILVADDHSVSAGAAISWTCPTSAPGLRIISTNRTSGLYSPGASEVVGASTTAFSIQGCAAVYGLTLGSGATVGATADFNIATSTTGPHYLVLQDCTIEITNTSTSATYNIHAPAPSSNNDESNVFFKNCTFRFGSTQQSLFMGDGYTHFDGCSFSASGVAPVTVFTPVSGVGLARFDCTGCDWSGKAWTNLVTIGASQNGLKASFWGCKFPASYTVTTGTTNIGSYEVSLVDCQNGGTPGIFGFHTDRGSCTSSTTVYFTSGAAAQSWNIATSALATQASPFYTPWIDLYNSDTSTAIAPYIEILRNNDSTSAWTDAQVWIEVMAPTTGGTTRSFTYTDRAGFGAAGSSQSTGAGAGSWTGETGSCWFGKVGLASSITPAVAGHIRARVGVAIASTSALFVDPQIRT